ncbi:MAG: peptidylprolyl isomerase [Ginsengibacter sp.]
MKQILIFLIILLYTGCSKSVFKTRWTKEIAPANFTARFETSKGNFDVEMKREWSPKAADRCYQLLKHHFLDGAVFFRAIPEFVAQFGSSDTNTIKRWEKIKVPDEPVILGNGKGTISFARAGKQSRGTQLFINLYDNQFLDTIHFAGVTGFPAFGKITNGMQTVDSLYTGYSGKTMDTLGTLYANRSKFLELFPKLDSIKKAYIVTIKK